MSDTDGPNAGVADVALPANEDDRDLQPVAAGAEPFASILFPSPNESADVETRDEPAYFHDLNLDQIVASITKRREEYNLLPFFRTPLHDIDAVRYRQEVMRDLEHAETMTAIRAFSDAMRTMRGYLVRAAKGSYKRENERWFLNAIVLYTDAVTRLERGLRHLDLASRGMCAFRDYVAAYAAGAPFETLVAGATNLVAQLSAIRYTVVMNGRSVAVRPYQGEPDYTHDIETTFDKFRRGEVRDYLVKFPQEIGLNHVEAQILNGVATLNPEVFRALESFCGAHADYVDPTLARFDREVQFYVAYLAHLDLFKRSGLPFSYPRVSTTSKEIGVRDAFDLALAATLIEQRRTVVRNDLWVRGSERLLVVSGPNQGGKTTFARMVGQLHYLASLGGAVPGTDAQLFLPDRIFTHFERQEHIATLRGKLQDDLVRVRQIVREATAQSVVIMNEMFSSTTLRDALYLSRQIMAQLAARDALCVWVTFLTDLTSFNDQTVSVVSAIDPSDPAIRTYKVERKPADGLAYALAIAEKYHVTARWVHERVPG